MSYDLVVRPAPDSSPLPEARVREVLVANPLVRENGESGYVYADEPTTWMEIDLELDQGQVTQILVHVPYAFLEHAPFPWLADAVQAMAGSGWEVHDEQSGDSFSPAEFKESCGDASDYKELREFAERRLAGRRSTRPRRDMTFGFLMILIGVLPIAGLVIHLMEGTFDEEGLPRRLAPLAIAAFFLIAGIRRIRAARRA